MSLASTTSLESQSSCSSPKASVWESWASPPKTPSQESCRRSCLDTSPHEAPADINMLPEHLLLACFSFCDWDTRFNTLPRVCCAWAALALAPHPQLWESVTVDFTAHMWLRAARLTAWLARRSPAVRALSLLNSDTSAAPWAGGWGAAARMRSPIHDFYPHTGEGLRRVLEPLAALRTLCVVRCDDLLQRGALAPALAGLRHLRRLEVATAGPATWAGVDWSALPELRHLDLRCGPQEGLGAFNPWGDAEADAFPLPLAGLTGLESLALACPGVTAVPDELAGLRGLRRLALSSSALRELPAAVGELCELRELSLTGCALGGWGRDGAVQGGLWALPPELARCPLQRLDLMRCGLTELPIAVGTLGRLEELSLGCNHISWLPTNLQGLASLKSLSLYSNDLRGIPPGLACLTNLEELFLDANPRLQFGGGASVITQLPKLRCLSVMQEGCHHDMAFDFWSESSICFLHHLDLTLKKRHNGRGYVRLH
uniref:Uncharacterized protein n=2 Tax=Auxenochlorella protothecoides TaxID=3075 RepID=A0A1D2ADY3_AUXPR